MCGIVGYIGPKDPVGVLVDGLRRRYWTRWPLPSTAPGTPCFEPRRYWRGPSWVNVNWLLAESLGRELVARTLELVKQSGCWEYYHPRTGEGLGGPAFSWTAALALDLLESVVHTWQFGADG